GVNVTGLQWKAPKVLGEIEKGCDAISWRSNAKIGVAFTYRRPKDNRPTGLFYVETSDFGQTWTTARHEKVETPITSASSTALVFDYATGGRTVSLKDLNFDLLGNPTILHQASPGGLAGDAGPYLWLTARSTSRGWRVG